MQISSAVSVKKKASGSVLTTPVALPGRQKRLASISDTSKTSLKPQGLCHVVTRDVQKVRSLIQLTTEYEHDILSLFSIVPFNKNALGPAILQSSYSIVEEFLILVLHPVTRGAELQITSSSSANFRPFMNSFSFGNK